MNKKKVLTPLAKFDRTAREKKQTKDTRPDNFRFFLPN